MDSVALASGMMVAASVSLVYEGATFNEVSGDLTILFLRCNSTQSILDLHLQYNKLSGFFGYHSLWRVFAGFLLGIGFILCTKKVLDQYEDIKFGNIGMYYYGYLFVLYIYIYIYIYIHSEMNNSFSNINL